MCDSIDGKCPEEANPQTQGVGSWLSGDREGMESDCSWGRGFLWGHENILELDHNERFTNLQVH